MTGKAVLISIKPKWCELIAKGSKNIEIRKSRPKLETPFKCYIYCTKPDKSYQTKCGSMVLNDDELYRHPAEGIKHGNSIELMCRDDYSNNNFLNGKVIGEFVCDRIDEYRAEFCDFEYSDCMNDECALNQILKVIAYDDYDKTPIYLFETSNEKDDPDDCELVKNSKVTFERLRKYIGETFFDKPVYGWHISNLIIYDEPKELSELKKFNRDCWYADLGLAKRDCPDCNNADCFLSRPPQSWCYVEVM